MRWDEFSTVLGAVLHALPADSTLIIQEKPPEGRPPESRFVQFAKWGDILHAEVGSGSPPKRWLRRLLSSPSAVERAKELAWVFVEERLTGSGWSAPPENGHPNWWREQPASAPRQDQDKLAGDVTWVLAEVFGVAEPTELQYTAWRDEPHEDLELHTLGLSRFATP